MKQTAVEWLVDELELDMFATDEEMEIIIKAKEMQKEQINKAFYDGYYEENLYDYKKYYNETFKQQDK